MGLIVVYVRVCHIRGQEINAHRLKFNQPTVLINPGQLAGW